MYDLVQNLPFGKRPIVKSYALWLKDDRFYLSPDNKLAQNTDSVAVSDATKKDVAIFTVLNNRTYPSTYIEALTYLVYDLNEITLEELMEEDKIEVEKYHEENYIK